jgi:hypothetical protein
MLFTTMVAGALLASPVIVKTGGGPIMVGGMKATTVPQSLPFALAGLVLLALMPYTVTLVAGADAAVSRSLLFNGGPQRRLRAELTEVAAFRARLAGVFEAELRRIERDLHDLIHGSEHPRSG